MKKNVDEDWWKNSFNKALEKVNSNLKFKNMKTVADDEEEDEEDEDEEKEKRERSRIREKQKKQTKTKQAEEDSEYDSADEAAFRAISSKILY